MCGESDVASRASWQRPPAEPFISIVSLAKVSFRADLTATVSVIELDTQPTEPDYQAIHFHHDAARRNSVCLSVRPSVTLMYCG